MWIKKIKELLEDGDPYFQEDIRKELNNPDRAILTGYLRCLVEIGEIKSKTRGVAKVYFLNKSTNVEFFVIKKIIGKNYLIIQEVKKQRRTDNITADLVKAGDRLEKADIPIKAYISNDGYIHICEGSYKRSLWKTEQDKEHYETASGFGH